MLITKNLKRIIVAYSGERLAVNNFFAQSLVKNFIISGAQSEIVDIDKLSADELEADACVMRTDNYVYSDKLHARGIKVFNHPFISLICNDKYSTFKYINCHGFRTLDTSLFDKSILPTINSKNFPLIAKSRRGHGGTQVFFCKDLNELCQAFDTIGEENIVIQKPASTLGKDLRVYVMDRKIIASVLRQSDIDFRSNFSLGGKPTVYHLSNAEKKMAIAISELFPSGFFGIDFIFDNGELVLNEIEDVVGTRMLYSLGLLDAAELYANYILSNTK